MSNERAHALLSPSSAKRWLNCTPSVRFGQQFPRKSSDAADEGTLAHSLGELLIAYKRNQITNKEFRRQLKTIEENKFYNKAMYEHCDNYATYVLERFNAAKAENPEAELYVEQRLDLSTYVPDSFGTGDVGIIYEPAIEIIDLKYGEGVLVNAVENEQLMLYALGWLQEYGWLHDLQTVRMTIYQPRRDYITTYEITVLELLGWADQVVAPAAAKAMAGDGEFVAGAHCLFCPAENHCKTKAEFNLQAAQMEFRDLFEEDGETVKTELNFRPENRLVEKEIVALLTHGPALKSYVEKMSAYALEQALNGRVFRGFKLVEGRSSRKITDSEAVQKILLKEGYDRHKMFKPQEMVSMTELEKLTGKKDFDRLIAPYTIKSPGAPTLAPLSDPRKPYKNATEDFKDLDDDF